MLVSIPSVYGFEITEVMSNPEGSDNGREWIEVYSEDIVNITDWKLVENEENHNLVVKQGNLTFVGFAIIADNWEKFLVDYPDYSGVLLDSSFSLKNDGETIEIRSGNVSISKITYGKVEEGKSWCGEECDPTPGEEYSLESSFHKSDSEHQECSPEIVEIKEIVEIEKIIEIEKKDVLFYVKHDEIANTKDNITTQIFIINQLDNDTNLQIQSYVHNGNELKSESYNEGWYGGWAGNKKNYTISSESMEVINLINRVNEPGEFNLRIKINGDKDENIDNQIKIIRKELESNIESINQTYEKSEVTSYSILRILRKLFNS